MTADTAQRAEGEGIEFFFEACARGHIFPVFHRKSTWGLTAAELEQHDDTDDEVDSFLHGQMSVASIFYGPLSDRAIRHRYYGQGFGEYFESMSAQQFTSFLASCHFEIVMVPALTGAHYKRLVLHNEGFRPLGELVIPATDQRAIVVPFDDAQEASATTKIPRASDVLRHFIHSDQWADYKVDAGNGDEQQGLTLVRADETYKIDRTEVVALMYHTSTAVALRATGNGGLLPSLGVSHERPRSVPLTTTEASRKEDGSVPGTRTYELHRLKFLTMTSLCYRPTNSFFRGDDVNLVYLRCELMQAFPGKICGHTMHELGTGLQGKFWNSSPEQQDFILEVLFMAIFMRLMGRVTVLEDYKRTYTTQIKDCRPHGVPQRSQAAYYCSYATLKTLCNLSKAVFQQHPEQVPPKLKHLPQFRNFIMYMAHKGLDRFKAEVLASLEGPGPSAPAAGAAGCPVAAVGVDRYPATILNSRQADEPPPVGDAGCAAEAPAAPGGLGTPAPAAGAVDGAAPAGDPVPAVGTARDPATTGTSRQAEGPPSVRDTRCEIVDILSLIILDAYDGSKTADEKLWDQVQFLSHQSLADVEEFVLFPFGVPTEASIHEGYGGNEGGSLWKRIDPDAPNVAEAHIDLTDFEMAGPPTGPGTDDPSSCASSVGSALFSTTSLPVVADGPPVEETTVKPMTLTEMFQALAGQLSLVSVAFRTAVAMKYHRGVLSWHTGRPFALTDVKHINCKVFQDAGGVYASNTGAERPVPFKSQCFPVPHASDDFKVHSEGHFNSVLDASITVSRQGMHEAGSTGGLVEPVFPTPPRNYLFTDEYTALHAKPNLWKFEFADGEEVCCCCTQPVDDEFVNCTTCRGTVHPTCATSVSQGCFKCLHCVRVGTPTGHQGNYRCCNKKCKKPCRVTGTDQCFRCGGLVHPTCGYVNQPGSVCIHCFDSDGTPMDVPLQPIRQPKRAKVKGSGASKRKTPAKSRTKPAVPPGPSSITSSWHSSQASTESEESLPESSSDSPTSEASDDSHSSSGSDTESDRAPVQGAHRGKVFTTLEASPARPPSTDGGRTSSQEERSAGAASSSSSRSSSNESSESDSCD